MSNRQDNPGSQPSAGGKLVVVSGPSGVGKSTINREVIRRSGAAFSTSATTRSPRDGEVDGRDYYFMDRPAFERMIERNELLEWADVFGNLYGTPAAVVREAMAGGKVVLLEIDVQGAMQVHEKLPEATFVLIAPPDDEELRRRLTGRGTESDESLQRRLGKARSELETARDSGIYDHVVINNDLETAIR
ncbi:MAG: guanylate kinase, partial [Phycisphaerae bacterium]|nr:guanylate kinase [Phycisphaerae bacterium]